MSITIPKTPFYFKVPGRGEMQFWRLDREEGPLFTLDGVSGVDGKGVHAYLEFSGPDLAVTHATYRNARPGGGDPVHLSRKSRAAFESRAREDLLACLAAGNWEAVTGY